MRWGFTKKADYQIDSSVFDVAPAEPHQQVSKKKFLKPLAYGYKHNRINN